MIEPAAGKCQKSCQRPEAPGVRKGAAQIGSKSQFHGKSSFYIYHDFCAKGGLFTGLRECLRDRCDILTRGVTISLGMKAGSGVLMRGGNNEVSCKSGLNRL
jgi:hypothetical protein